MLEFHRLQTSQKEEAGILHMKSTLLMPLTKHCMLLGCSSSLHVVQLPVQVQIGCHTDDLSEAEKLSRAPVITYQCCMDRTQRSVSCLWGGLLYVIVPKGCQMGSVSVTIQKAVPAPYYKLGEWTGHCGKIYCRCLGD